MRRITVFAFALALVLSLTACGDLSGGEVKLPSDVTIGGDSGDEQQPGKNEETEKLEETISEQIIVDEAGIKITAKNLETDGIFGPEIKLLIENNSGKDLTFQCRNASVNGYMVETMMSVDVANGKKANDSLTFAQSDMELCGIDVIADMEFSFHIFDMSDWETYLDTESVQIKTSIADTYEYIYDDSGTIAYQGEDIKIVIKGLNDDDSIFGPGVVVYIENNGGKNITVQVRDVSVNGFMVDPMFSCDVAAGKHAVDTITLMESDLEENEITVIETIELYFHVFDFEDWDTIVDTDIVTIAF